MNKKLTRLVKQNRADSRRLPLATKLFSANRFGPLVFLLVFMTAGAAFIYSSSAAPTRRSGTTAQTTMYVTPTKQRLTVNDSLIVNIWVNSYSQPVNAVQTVLLYPTDKLTYVSSDTNSSQFTIQAESTNDNGRLVLARGTTTPLTGDQLVATVVFKPVAGGKAELKFDASSQLLSSETNTNILGLLTGGSYTIGN